jgi:hypothetical protein
MPVRLPATALFAGLPRTRSPAACGQARCLARGMRLFAQGAVADRCHALEELNFAPTPLCRQRCRQDHPYAAASSSRPAAASPRARGRHEPYATKCASRSTVSRSTQMATAGRRPRNSIASLRRERWHRRAAWRRPGSGEQRGSRGVAPARAGAGRPPRGLVNLNVALLI